MATKQCPSCKKSVATTVMECDCGYDWTKMDCPGCNARIPDDTAVCPNCRYDIVEDKPAKKEGEKKTRTKKKDDESPKGNVVVATGRKTVPAPVEDDEYEDKPKPRKPGGMMLTHSVALGNYGQKDANYTELYWPKGEEVNDDTLLAWAENFRQAYREKVLGRSTSYLSNIAIAGWCRNWAKDQAKRHDKEGQNDVLFENADRILMLLGGKERQE